MKRSLEDIKQNSKQLRGGIASSLQSDDPIFSADDVHVLKFHGIYQQDNRDARKQRHDGDRSKQYSYMVRSSIPGGTLTAAQYLAHDGIVDALDLDSLRITSRQGLQFHGVHKGDLKTLVRSLEKFQVTTWAACGDVVRNVVASPLPASNPAQLSVQELAHALDLHLKPERGAYSEIWLDGDRLEQGHVFLQDDSLYGESYLPRKFKIGIAVPPNNDIDVFTHDLGFIAHVESQHVVGYTIVVGGGMGMSFGKPDTHPALAKPIYFVRPDQAVDVARAVIEVQREYGNRHNRKRARLKYLIEDRGLDWLRSQVELRLPFTPESPRDFQFKTLTDPFGWQTQGDDKLFFGMWIENGRIVDYDYTQYRTALREIATHFQVSLRFTTNHNVIISDIKRSDRKHIQSILSRYAIPDPDTLSFARRTGMACVALPTCGLALAESERVFSDVLQRIDEHLQILGLDREPLLIRMTGCPNGCARPYNADFAFVGRSPGIYSVFIGGSHVGDRLAQLQHERMALQDLPDLIGQHLKAFAAQRQGGESFSEYWGRTRLHSKEPDAASFHRPEPATLPV